MECGSPSRKCGSQIHERGQIDRPCFHILLKLTSRIFSNYRNQSSGEINSLWLWILDCVCAMFSRFSLNDCFVVEIRRKKHKWKWSCAGSSYLARLFKWNTGSQVFHRLIRLIIRLSSYAFGSEKCHVFFRSTCEIPDKIKLIIIIVNARCY